MDKDQREHDQQQPVYHTAIISYVTAMAMAERMLDQRMITKKEFLAFENKMLQKYKLSPHSLYRDLHLLYPLDQR